MKYQRCLLTLSGILILTESNVLCSSSMGERRDTMHEYGVKLTKMKEMADTGCVIVVIDHKYFQVLNLDDIKKMFRDSGDSEKVLIDVMGLYKVEELKISGLTWWRL